jgi:ABC-type amino acid transport substrate-binding protein
MKDEVGLPCGSGGLPGYASFAAFFRASGPAIFAGFFTFFAVGCAVVATPGRGGADRGDRWAAVRAAGGGTVTVLYVPAEGFAERDDEGRVTGLTADLMHGFAAWLEARHGVRLRLDFVAEENWRTFYERVRTGTGGVFGLGNVTITEARRGEIAFSPPYMTNVAVLITPATVPELASLAELPVAFAGLTPLAFQGTLHEARLRALRDRYAPGTELAFATSNPEILARVAAGGHYAYIDGYNYDRAAAAGLPLRRHPVADDPGEEFGIIMPLSSDWQDALRAFFQDEG